MKPTEQIDQYIVSLSDWRSEIISDIRKAVLAADPEVTEEWKWGSPVWSHNGLICSASAFKNHVGVNFFNGASLNDNNKLFNSGLESKKSRTVKFVKGDKVNTAAIKELVKDAISYNLSK